MRTFSISKNSGNQSGMMLLEVLVAILLFSLGVLGMVMMQSVSSANSVNAQGRATAALLANDLIAELWASFNPAATNFVLTTPTDYATPNGWQARVAKALRNGSGTLTIIPPATAQIEIKWNAQGRLDSAPAYFDTQVVIE